MNISEKIFASIIVVTYNHEKYIEQCLNSLINQKTQYRYEILIADDCSQDRTAEIIRRYQRKYPELIHPLLRKKNTGGNRNAYTLLKHAKGDYLFFMDGDDYWCDENRMERDILFLEQNPQYVGVCGRCKLVDVVGNSIDETLVPVEKRFWDFASREYTIKDYEQWKMPGHMGACTCRNCMKDHTHDYSILYKGHRIVGDRTMLLLSVLQGDIKCTNYIGVCYRFRINSNEQNYMNVSHKINMRDQDYLLIKRIEDYVKQEYGRILNLDKIKKDRLIGSVCVFLKDANKDNFRVICNIIRYSNSPIKYVYYVIKIVIIKFYFKCILHMDKRIEKL